ncbi:MAG TPA: MBL fold metallo-hydrolase [Stellaceae bacterium]|jgi:phosphoribosyl 1,2-cyclic phosphate phosphodiesterase|nr:MBL fold metallo-hydrolase [Stellaceae bacterium]
MKVTMLGCGPSWGVPAIGPDWGACDPAEPRNRRRRCSLLVESRGAKLLIDMAPELRQQLLDAEINSLDAVLLTHAHGDHLHGLDDLRKISQSLGHAIPLHATPETMDEVAQRFGYALQPPVPGRPLYRPALTPRLIAGPFITAGMPIVPFPQNHGHSMTLGFRIGPVGYSTDVTELDENAFAALDGVELWIVDCLRRAPHPTHSHLAKTLQWIERVRPRRAVLTHMEESLDYRELLAELPEGVEPGYDGLTVELPDP